MIRRGVLCLIVLALAPVPLWVHDHLTPYASPFGITLGRAEAQRETQAIERQLRVRAAQRQLSADPTLVVEVRQDSKGDVFFAPVPAAEAAHIAEGSVEPGETPTLLPRSFSELRALATPLAPKDLAFVAASVDADPERFARLILPENPGSNGPSVVPPRVFWNAAQLHEAWDTLQTSMEHAEKLRLLAAAGAWALLALSLALAIWALASQLPAVRAPNLPRPRVTALVSERRALFTLALCTLSLPAVCKGLVQLPFFWEEPIFPLAYLAAAVLALVWCLQDTVDRVVLRGAIAAIGIILGTLVAMHIGKSLPGRFAPFLWQDPIFPVVYLVTAALLIVACVRAAVNGVAIRRAIAVLGVALVLAGAGATLRGCYTSSELWIRRQTDVRWHRDWQDLHWRDEIDAAEANIYWKLRLAHPDDPDWNYLALRAQPPDVEKRDAFAAAAEAFPESPWLAWSAGTTNGDLPQLLFAVKSLSPLPARLIEDALSLCTRDRNWPALKALWDGQAALIRSDFHLAASMAVADLIRGDREGTSQWIALAQGLESPRDRSTTWFPTSSLDTIDRLGKRLGWRPDLIGSVAHAEATGDHGRVEIVNVHAQDAADGARLGYDPAIGSYLNTLGEGAHRGLEGLGDDPYRRDSPKLQSQLQAGSLSLSFLIKYTKPLITVVATKGQPSDLKPLRTAETSHGVLALLGGPLPTFTLRTLDGRDLAPAEQGPKGDFTQLTFLLPPGAQVSELVTTIGMDPNEARLHLDLKPQSGAAPIVGIRPD